MGPKTTVVFLVVLLVMNIVFGGIQTVAFFTTLKWYLPLLVALNAWAGYLCFKALREIRRAKRALPKPTFRKL